MNANCILCSSRNNSWFIGKSRSKKQCFCLKFEVTKLYSYWVCSLLNSPHECTVLAIAIDDHKYHNLNQLGTLSVTTLWITLHFVRCTFRSMETIHDRQWLLEPDTASVTSTALVIDCKTKQILKMHISDNSLRFGVIEHETTKQPPTTELKQFHLHSLNPLTMIPPWIEPHCQEIPTFISQGTKHEYMQEKRHRNIRKHVLKTNTWSSKTWCKSNDTNCPT